MKKINNAIDKVQGTPEIEALSTSQDDLQTPSAWGNITDNALELMNQNPVITCIAATALTGTTAYYIYKYFTRPKMLTTHTAKILKELQYEQENSTVSDL